MEFDWNLAKAQSNLQKHKVSFEEAQTVFDDPLRISFLDVEHSVDEDRYITIGLSNRSRVLLIAHTYRHERIRIISARGVTNYEQRYYAEGL